ncbi:DMT family transporter [Paenactinomyces guangxiensis]|uniref:DMT family transporter n=1 Tax=Paenactinomyces guangxiensis TaxID=1490290 RepID=A0A7W1WQJ2_9BACL|nr:DMT family transporter [Paenactinomyces guangxiensis]MBA4494182.1 DMT family transporter [Paenactinomyces guangxiensis]MBH8590678.1 DMT family transporter [Paenactinomyces guangxiensis]
MTKGSATHPSDPGHRMSYFVLITTMVFWGSAFVSSKVAIDSVPPSVAALIRFGLAALFMLLFLRTRRKEIRTVPRESWFGLAILGLLGVAVYNLLFFWGLAFSRASDGTMIIPTLSPAVTVLLAALFLKEKLGRKQVGGLCLALIGSLVFFSAIGLGEVVNIRRMTGDLLFLAAAVCWSVYTLLGRKLLHKVDPMPATAYAMLFGSIALGFFAISDLSKVQWSGLSAGFWANQFYLALFPTVIANWFYYIGVKGIGAPRAAVFMYFVPVSGLVLAGLILNDVPTPVQLIGSALMLLGVWLVNHRAAPSPTGQEQKERIHHV